MNILKPLVRRDETGSTLDRRGSNDRIRESYAISLSHFDGQVNQFILLW